MATQNRPYNWTFIAWAPYSRRSETFAQAFGAKLHLIHYLKFQSPLQAPFKYVLQTIRTWQLLFKERPEVVFVQNPPFVSSLAVYLYCWLTHARFVIDYHSASFARIWDWALPIQRFLARRAKVNMVTNQHWADIVYSWGARPMVMKDPFVQLPKGDECKLDPNFFNVIVINTFAPDEPLEEVLQAAAQLPGVKFYISGNTKRKPASFFTDLPSNVTFTGFLPDDQYLGLFSAVDAALALTTRNYTLQRGGCEAVAMGKPLITSNWPFLQEFFAKGTVYVANTVDSIREGILTMQQEHRRLENEIVEFRHESRRDWDAQLAQLHESLL